MKKKKVTKSSNKNKQVKNVRKSITKEEALKTKENSNNKNNGYNKNAIAFVSFLGLIAVGVLIYFLAFNHGNMVTPQRNLVAEYGSHKVYADELDKEYKLFLMLKGIPEQYKSLIPEKAYLNQSIIQNLIYDDAVAHGFTKSSKDAEKLVTDSLKASGMTLQKFKDNLKQKGFDYNYVIDYLRKQMVISDYLNKTIFSKVSVSETDALMYYNEHKDEFVTKDMIRVSHILVNSSGKAEEIIAELDNGADFSELAKKYSKGPSASRGGDLGFFAKGTMVKEFEDAAFSLKHIGEYTEKPVKTQFGWHIIKLTNISKSHQLSFNDVKQQLIKTLQAKEQNDMLKKYIDGLKKKTTIKIYLGSSKEVKSDKPKIELFVMSYCPFGTQIEKGILPVIEALKDKVDFEVKFCDYAMHGKKELEENTRQYCIEKEQKSKYLDYLKCFLEKGDFNGCVDKTGIDKAKLNKCAEDTDKEFKITEGYNDKSTYKGGFPRFDIFEKDVQKYNVLGSPTLVINGVKRNSNRDPESLAKLICSSFKNPPQECSESFDRTVPSPGFGFTGSGTSTTASCGG